MKVEFFLWDISKSKVPLAILKMATNHIYLKRDKSISFYKLLGTGKGETFTPSDANLLRWGLLVVSHNGVNSSSIINRWNKISISKKYYELSPISSIGSWAGKQPFDASPLKNSNSEIAVITRARIKFKLSNLFWRSVPPVVLSLKTTPGLNFAIGIGEAPVGLQGTLSIWVNNEAVTNFAHKGEAHSRVIKQTRQVGWYSEELFARFEVVAKAE